MSNSLGEAVLDLTADKEPLMKDIESAKPGALAALDNIGMLGGKLLAAGIAVAATAIIGITTMMWEAGNTLDAAYDTIQQRTGATGEQLEILKDDFDEVFSSVPASADDAATAVSILNQRLGITGPVLQDTSAALLEMTRITGGDLLTNGEAFTRMVGDWGLAGEDVAVSLDEVFVASQQTGTGVDRLMQLVVQFGAPMRSFGFSFEESIAMLGKWEKEGVNTELVMGSLRIASGKFANAQVPLRQGLEDAFNAIKNAKDESAALAIAMDVFGAKAGPDMAAAIRENRFELGDLVGTIQEADGAIMEVSESTMDWAERWTLFKNRMTKALGPGGMGLMEAAGKGLKAIEDLVARQDVQDGLMKIVNGIVTLAQNAAAYLPTAIDNFFRLVEFLKNNEGVVVAILAVLGTAILAFAVTLASAAWTAMAPFLPVIAIIALVAAAAYLLYEAWTNNWGGIRDLTMQFWAWLQPILQTLWSWLSTNIPLALQTLSLYWTGTLLPAIMTVWGWLNGTLFPFLQALANFLSAVFSIALTALAGIWQNVLLPAFQAAYAVLSEKLMPVFQALANFWRTTLQPILQAIAQWVGVNVVGAFTSLTTKLQAVTTWLNHVATMLNSMQLPAWMTPGSPTPWEIGLWGINDALKAVGNVSLPNLSGSMNMMPAPAIASSGVALNAGGAGAFPANKTETTINITGNNFRDRQDIDYMAQEVARRIAKT